MRCLLDNVTIAVVEKRCDPRQNSANLIGTQRRDELKKDLRVLCANESLDGCPKLSHGVCQHATASHFNRLPHRNAPIRLAGVLKQLNERASAINILRIEQE
jgi:hypothetical protein